MVFDRLFVSAALAGMMIGGVAGAATQSVAVNVSFDVPLTLSNDNEISFGTLKAGTGGSYVIDTNGAVTPSNGGVVIGGTQASGKITISGSATQSVAISTGSYAANGGVIPSAATCNYGGLPIADCDAGGTGPAPGGAGKVLKLGVTVHADGTQTPGSTATPSFVVTVVYG
jgi:hypothetical protein